MEANYLKCQILFSGKNMKNIINLLTAELAKIVVKVKSQPLVTTTAEDILFCCS